jgi:hypothetical protein
MSAAIDDAIKVIEDEVGVEAFERIDDADCGERWHTIQVVITDSIDVPHDDGTMVYGYTYCLQRDRDHVRRCRMQLSPSFLTAGDKCKATVAGHEFAHTGVGYHHTDGTFMAELCENSRAHLSWPQVSAFRRYFVEGDPGNFMSGSGR